VVRELPIDERRRMTANSEPLGRARLSSLLATRGEDWEHAGHPIRQENAAT
jgi:hypothetical protein